jgi:hypothetical protein
MRVVLAAILTLERPLNDTQHRIPLTVTIIILKPKDYDFLGPSESHGKRLTDPIRSHVLW